MINHIEPGWVVQRVEGDGLCKNAHWTNSSPRSKCLVQRVVRVPHERLVKLEKPLVQGLCRGCAGFLDRVFDVKTLNIYMY